MALKELRRSGDGNLLIEDGSTLSAEVELYMGDFSLAGLSGVLAELQVIQVRQKVAAALRGAAVPPTGSFSAKVEAGFSLWDPLTQTGAWAGFVSTSGTGCSFPTHKLTLTLDCGSGGDTPDVLVLEDVAIQDFTYAQADDGDTFTINFTVLGSVTLNGQTVTVPQAA